MKGITKASRKIKVGLSVLLAVILLTVFTAHTSRNFEIARHLDIFSTLFRELIVNYVDDVNPAEVIKAGIDEMLYSLDPYTNFIPESQIEDVRFMTTGQYGGIGALIFRRDEYVVISEPHQGFPAQEAGLMAGDRILEINGQSARGLNQEEVSNLLKGQPGTTVRLLIGRDDVQQPFTRELERRVVTIDNIPYYGMLDENTAYIRLSGFTQHAGRDVKEALNALRAENNPSGLILDLRGNGGGLLHEAVNIVNLFVDKNKLVVSTKGRLAERNTTHRTLNDPIDLDIPLVVLVDRGSASASEIVAGAIQDFDRGVILGQRTFGKGLVQNVVPLSFNTQLKVTVAKYYIPSGRCIQAIDYAQRNEDGSVAMIPDSLKTAFKTSSGRVVYDGGGIEPDIAIEEPQYASITRELMARLVIFDYASYYRRKYDKLPDPSEFEITDDIYLDFIRFVHEKGFDYTTESERRLQRMKEAAMIEGYFDHIRNEYQVLHNKLLHNKDEDLQTFRGEISGLLREEIASRYYYQRGRIKATLKDDAEIREALRLFSDQSRYRSLLSVQ